MTANPTPPRQRVMYPHTVAKIIDHTPLTREVVFQAQGEGICFKAGQFCTMHIPQVTATGDSSDAKPKAIMRAYSFASDERSTKEFRLLLKYVEGGVASNYVWGFKGGETVNFTGPFGRIFFREPPSQQIVFLNTGSGITQHMCYLLSKKEQYPNLRYRMLFGLRHESDIFYRQQLEEIQKTLTDFKFEYVLSRPEGKWTGKKGYVQNFISEFDYKNIDTTFYLCGNGGMIKEVKQILAENNFDKTRILAEAFS